jgi:phosphoglycerol transferase MdoB-like AlkP superfamily enzyme
MRKFYFFFIKIILFWIAFFFLLRAAFLIFLSTTYRSEPFLQMIKALWYGLSMDLAATAYILSLPIILLFVWLFIKNDKWHKPFRIYTYIMIVFCAFLNVADMGLFGEWETRLNSKALSYLAFPKEAIMSANAAPVWLLLFVLALQSFIGIYSFKKIIRFPEKIANSKVWKKLTGIVILSFFLFTMVRGGFQTYPINRGWVYYSDKPSLNIAAVNTFWNVFEIALKPRITKNPYNYMDKAKAEKITEEIFKTPADSTEYLFNVKKPNIVLIMMESLGADAVYSLGGEKDITPGIDSLCKQGLLFTNFYATGFRTEQGLLALMSAFPAQPASTIIRNFGKFEKLPCFATYVEKKGYSTSYYYGGNIGYANTDVYLLSGGFDKVTSKENFQQPKRTTDWGVYDDELYDFFISDIQSNSAPFFSIIMTSTNHEPFNAKVKRFFSGSDEVANYENTARFSDKCLNDFIQKAKKTSWYNNTIFIITGDHAHRLPKNRQYNEPDRHHTPFLIYGEPLKEIFRGKKISTVSSHLDFAATILAQLDIPSTAFPWSRNLMNKSCGNFAFYAFDNGFGVINEKQALVFDHNVGKVVLRKSQVSPKEDDALLQKGKSFLQVMFQKYIDLD